jgi:hypothetical protein
MTRDFKQVVIVGVLIAAFWSIATQTLAQRVAAPSTQGEKMLLLDEALLARNRQLVKKGDARLAPAMEKLRSEAELAVVCGPWSVVDKKLAPPSGDKHDYMSVGVYWWPNPDTPDGLPYVRRDGHINPDYFASDGGGLRAMTDALETLSLAYYFTSDERFAARAAKILRVWFLDETTRMNPNLRYAQAVPGVTEGRRVGIVDTSQQFPRYMDFIAMLHGSKAWTNADETGMKKWFGQYLDWLLETDPGDQQRLAMSNNQGTFQDLQIVTLALFTGRDELAKKVLSEVPAERIARQIEPDGRQPAELHRTRAFTYSTVNLLGFFHLATLAEPMGIDLWDYQTEDGRSIRGALDFMAQYAAPKSQWPYQEIGENKFRAVLYALLHRAAAKYGEPRYETILDDLPAGTLRDERFLLLYGPAQMAYHVAK